MIRQNHIDGYNLRSPYVIGLHDAKFSYPGKPWTFLFWVDTIKTEHCIMLNEAFTFAVFIDF